VRLVKLALLVTLVAAVPAGAQEPPLPEGAVARVGDELILKSDFDAWYPFVAAQTPWLVTNPPDYGRCMTTFRRRAAKHGRHPTGRSLRRRCEERAKLAHDLAMTVTLEDVWLHQEATRVGVVVTEPEITREVARYRRELKDKEWRRYRRAGVTDAQFAAAVTLAVLFERLIERARANIPEVTHAQVERYYRHHRRRYRHVSRERALKRIEADLNQERKWRATSRFVVHWFARYAKQTQCAQGYIVEWCANSESDGSDEGWGTYEPSRQSSTSIATFPGAEYTGAAPTAIAQPSS
jgi:hypothetical protein